MSTTIVASASSYADGTATTLRPYNWTILRLQSTGPQRLAYLDFGQPVPVGWTVISATLRLFQVGVAAGGSRTLSARLLTAAWSETTLDWNHKPGAGATAYASAAQGNGGADGRAWDMDVTAAMQAVAAGQAFYGFRVESNNATLMAVFSDDAPVAWQPQLILTVAPEPEPPTVLNPSGGRAVSIARPTVTFDFTDPDGDAMLGFQLQANPTDTWGAPALDTGTVASDVPAYTWTSDITLGDTTYWRVRVQDAAGLWSDWSDAEYFVRTAKPTVAWVDPPAATFGDPNVPTDVSLSGGPTQTARQVFLLDEDAATILHDSTKLSTTVTAYSISGDYLPTPDVTYTLLRRTWDNVERATTSGATEDPPYIDISKQVTYDTTGATPVSALAAAAEAGGLPGVTLTWTDTAGLTDQYLVVRNGVSYALVDFADTFVSGTSHEWTDEAAGGGDGSHSYQLFAVNGGVTADGSAIVTASILPVGVWIRTASGLALQLAGELTVEPNEISAVYSPLGATNQVVIRQARYKRKGRLEGGSFGDLSTDLDDIATLEATWEAIRTYADKNPVTLISVNRSIQALIYNTWTGFADEAIANNPGTWVPIGFDYIEQA